MESSSSLSPLAAAPKVPMASSKVCVMGSCSEFGSVTTVIALILLLVCFGFGVYALRQAWLGKSTFAGDSSAALREQRWVLFGKQRCPACRAQKEQLKPEEIAALYFEMDDQNPAFYLGLKTSDGKPAIDAIPAWVHLPEGMAVKDVPGWLDRWNAVANVPEKEREHAMQSLSLVVEVQKGMKSRGDLAQLVKLE